MLLLPAPLLQPPREIASAIRQEAKMICRGKALSEGLVWGMFSLLVKNYLTAKTSEVTEAIRFYGKRSGESMLFERQAVRLQFLDVTDPI
jgi:hypothetical protein